MVIPTPVPRILFLHGGPGMTAELERNRFGVSLPVRWWDQPVVSFGAGSPLNTLIDAAVAELNRLSTERQGPIDILASSFGAYLARALVDRMPKRIGTVTICGGIWDLSTAILRLGSWLARRFDETDLEKACRDTAEADTPQSYFRLFARISSMPEFLDCLWSPTASEERDLMKVLAAEGRLINWPTCQAVMVEALATPLCWPSRPHHEQVRIVIGRADPYFEDSDFGAWGRLWPGAAVELVETGQFPHLELPPPHWMPKDTVGK